MILQALAAYYDRLSQDAGSGLPKYGYSQEKISYEILLSSEGKVLQVNNICDTSGKKPKPRTMPVPSTGGRTSGIKPNFLWDKTSYALGVSNTSKRVKDEHQSFKQFHLDALKDSGDAGMSALRAFLEDWKSENFLSHPFNEEMKDANFVFRLDGEQGWLHDRPAAEEILRSLLVTATSNASNDDTKPSQSPPSESSICLVSGKRRPAARLHPPIKGVAGAQSSGAYLVSFNQDSFNSFGKKQGCNAPLSEESAFAYTTALNHLLRTGDDNRQRVRVGDTTIVFWAEAADQANNESAAAAEDFISEFFDSPGTDDQKNGQIRNTVELLRQGRALKDINPNLEPNTRVYILGLSPNASRLSVRLWLVNRLDKLVENLTRHANDIWLEPVPWKTNPSAYRLALATAPEREGSKPKIDDAFNIIVGDLLRSILSGRLYPRNLLSNTIMRMRADGHITGLRVALCKAVLNRECRLLQRTFSEEIPVSLDKTSVQPGYLLGRLFAVLEYTQRAALGGTVNATIRDRYYGAASATPASIFPVLMRNAVNHLAKLRKERAGQAVNLEKMIQEIVAGLPDHFPASLNIENQGRFAIGYYHQSQSHFAKQTNGAQSADAQV